MDFDTTTIHIDYRSQDAATIQQLRAMQQRTIIIEWTPGSPIVDESKCVEGTISEVRDNK